MDQLDRAAQIDVLAIDAVLARCLARERVAAPPLVTDGGDLRVQRANGVRTLPKQ